MPLRDSVAQAREIDRRPAVSLSDIPIDRARVLALVGLNPNDPRAHAVVAVAERYGLDPVLGHIEIIPNSQRPYITRDGYLHIAHRTGQLDGIEVVDGPRREGAEWVARVAVWRKDMSRAFIYPGRADVGGRDNGPEMAIARAERRALKRAFAVTVPATFADPDREAPTRPPNAPRATLTAERPRADTSGTPETAPATPAVPADLADEADPADVRPMVDVPLPGDEAGGPSDGAEPIRRGQQVAIFSYFTSLGIKEREQRLAEISRIVGREIGTSNDLSAIEARAVLSTLSDILEAYTTDDSETHTTEEGAQDEPS